MLNNNKSETLTKMVEGFVDNAKYHLEIQPKLKELDNNVEKIYNLVLILKIERFLENINILIENKSITKNDADLLLKEIKQQNKEIQEKIDEKLYFPLLNSIKENKPELFKNLNINEIKDIENVVKSETSVVRTKTKDINDI